MIEKEDNHGYTDDERKALLFRVRDELGCGHVRECPDAAHRLVTRLNDALARIATLERELLDIRGRERDMMKRAADEAWRFAVQAASENYNGQIPFMELPEDTTELILSNVLIGDA